MAKSGAKRARNGRQRARPGTQRRDQVGEVVTSPGASPSGVAWGGLGETGEGSRNPKTPLGEHPWEDMALRLTLHFDLANFPTRRCRCSRNRPPTPRQPGPLGPPTPPTLSQPRTISWSATGRPPSAHSYPLLRRLPRAASLARLGRQRAAAHCSGWRGRLLLRRPCWSVSVGSYRPCPTHGTAAHGHGRQQEGSAGSSPVVASAASRRIAA